MKHTLLLRLAGPMQSWGVTSRFTIRDTGHEPSKSGVLGLLCAALGKPRDEAHADNAGQPTLAQLAALRLGVRVNQTGTPHKDFHTAGGSRHDDYGVVTAGGGKGGTVVSTRYYLADADFLAGLESDDLELLHTLDAALARPVWQLFLGRKSFVPSLPVRAGLVAASLEEALQSDWPQESVPRLRGVLEPVGFDPDAAMVRHDVPLCFATRRFTLRYVKTVWLQPSGKEVDPRGQDGKDIF